jgi:hypothetical protein
MYNTGSFTLRAEVEGLQPGEVARIIVPVANSAGQPLGTRVAACNPALANGRAICNLRVNEPDVAPLLGFAGGVVQVRVFRTAPVPAAGAAALPVPVAAGGAGAASAAQALRVIPLPPPPPILVPPPPSPPLLPPLPPLAPSPAAAPAPPFAPEVPLIPEADTVVLVVAGLVVLGAARRWRRP